MSKVLQFPDFAARDWPELYAGLNEIMDNSGVPKRAQKRILDGMEDFHKNMKFNFEKNFEYTYPENVSRQDAAELISNVSGEMQSSFEEALGDLVGKLVAERFYREVEFCRGLGLL